MDDTFELEQRAIELRRIGNFTGAADLFAEAAGSTSDQQRRLNLRIRQACCLLSVDRSAEAAELAASVAYEARLDGHLVELADAVGVVVDHHIRSGKLAEASLLMSEALDVMEQLPVDPSSYQVIHNLAATYEHSGFYGPAIELFARALEAAGNDEERAFTRASMASGYHFAAALATDPEEKQRILEAGLAAATEYDSDDVEVLTRTSALANSAMILTHIGHYDEALVRAEEARVLAEEHHLVEDGMFAAAAAAISTWRLRRDPAVLGRVVNTLALAEKWNRSAELAILQDVEVEVLWSLGRYDEARRALEQHLALARHRVTEEREVRWQHVRLGVEHRRVAALSNTDPLTGLHNRRYLERVLPSLLQGDERLVVGVIDLDGFKQVNDQLGYATGDQVIREVASLLEGVCRRSDTVVRLGGDEFVMVLHGAGMDAAVRVFERVRENVERHQFTGLPEHIRLSASVGVLTLGGSDGRDIREVLAAASTAMQSSKKQGKNRITFVEV